MKGRRAAIGEIREKSLTKDVIGGKIIETPKGREGAANGLHPDNEPGD